MSIYIHTHIHISYIYTYTTYFIPSCGRLRADFSCALVTCAALGPHFYMVQSLFPLSLNGLDFVFAFTIYYFSCHIYILVHSLRFRLENGLYFVSRLFPNYLYLCFCLWVPWSEQDWAGCLRISYDFQPVAEFVPLSMPSNTICFLSKRFHNCLQLVFVCPWRFVFLQYRVATDERDHCAFGLCVACLLFQKPTFNLGSVFRLTDWSCVLIWWSVGLCILPWAVGGFTSEPIWTNV